MPTFSRPTDPVEFLHEIENFAASPAVAELLCRIEDQLVSDWKLAQTTEKREAAWHGQKAVEEMRVRMTSLAGGKAVFDAHAKARQRTVPTGNPFN